jgi:hypothetical protein
MVKVKTHQPFKKWHHNNLVKLLEFAEKNKPHTLQIILDAYDEYLRGN